MGGHVVDVFALGTKPQQHQRFDKRQPNGAQFAQKVQPGQCRQRVHNQVVVHQVAAVRLEALQVVGLQVQRQFRRGQHGCAAGVNVGVFGRVQQSQRQRRRHFPERKRQQGQEPPGKILHERVVPSGRRGVHEARAVQRLEHDGGVFTGEAVAGLAQIHGQVPGAAPKLEQRVGEAKRHAHPAGKKPRRNKKKEKPVNEKANTARRGVCDVGPPLNVPVQALRFAVAQRHQQRRQMFAGLQFFHRWRAISCGSGAIVAVAVAVAVATTVAVPTTAAVASTAAVAVTFLQRHKLPGKVPCEHGQRCGAVPSFCGVRVRRDAHHTSAGQLRKVVFQVLLGHGPRDEVARQAFATLEGGGHAAFGDGAFQRDLNDTQHDREARVVHGADQHKQPVRRRVGQHLQVVGAVFVV